MGIERYDVGGFIYYVRIIEFGNSGCNWCTGVSGVQFVTLVESQSERFNMVIVVYKIVNIMLTY